MVGSTSFSSGARISVIPSFAVQSIAAPCIGCQKDSFWNGRHRGDFPTMVKTIQLTSLAVSLLATRVLSVALLYSGHCSLFTTLEHWYLQYQ
jgi:Ni,Fe-hydrogenase I small subunit